MDNFLSEQVDRCRQKTNMDEINWSNDFYSDVFCTIYLIGSLNNVSNSHLSGLRFFVYCMCIIMLQSHLNNMEIPETRRFLPKGFELGTTMRKHCEGSFYSARNSCYRSCIHGQSLVCLQLHADEAYGSIQWKMTHWPRFVSKLLITTIIAIDPIGYLQLDTHAIASRLRDE